MIKEELWYHSTNVGMTRTGTEQVVIFPASGTVISKYTLSGEGCGLLEGAFKYEGDMAGSINPEGTEVEVEKLIYPTEQQRHVWRYTGSGSNEWTETQQKLLFNGTEADGVGEAEAKLENKEKFGTIE
jgi:hypothetical protein